MEIDSHLFAFARKKYSLKLFLRFVSKNIFTCFQIIISNYLCLFFIFVSLCCCHHFLYLLENVQTVEKKTREITSDNRAKPFDLRYRSFMCRRFLINVSSHLWREIEFSTFCGSMDRLDCAKMLRL